MLRFKNYISEEVLPTANVQDGNIDIRNEAVRSQINANLMAVTAQPAVTPYIILNRVSKALSYFHIILPKKTFLEGTKGIEVYLIRQFGVKMGMTDQGEFIKEFPDNLYLFFQYGVARPMNVTYTNPNVGGMFVANAKIVDKVELDRLLMAAEIVMAEDCGCDDRAMTSQRRAGREEIQTNGNHGTESTKKAMDTSERKSGKKLASGEEIEKDWPAVDKKKLEEELSHGARELTLHADNDQQLHRSSHQPIIKNLQRKHAKGTYDHEKATKLWKYHADRAAKSYEKQHGGKFSVADRKAAAAHFADSARDDHGFGSVKEEQIDEVSKGAAIRAYGAAKDASDSDSRAEKIAGRLKKHIARKFGGETVKHAERHAYASHFGRPNKDYGTDRLERAKPSSEMRKTKSGKVHKQDVESKKSEIKFRRKMSKFDKKPHLPEEALDEVMGSVKKTFAMKKMKKKVNTQVKQGLGIGKERTNTILVTYKGDPKAAGGGGVHRISRDKYDPTKHNMASE